VVIGGFRSTDIAIFATRYVAIIATWCAAFSTRRRNFHLAIEQLGVAAAKYLNAFISKVEFA
jgi:hypothetical protein